MKSASGKFNGDSFSDVAILHQISDGGFDAHILYGSAGTPFPDDGADVHVLWGSVGTPFGFSPTFARSLPVSEGWRWSQMKIVSRTSVN